MFGVSECGVGDLLQFQFTFLFIIWFMHYDYELVIFKFSVYTLRLNMKCLAAYVLLKLWPHLIHYKFFKSFLKFPEMKFINLSESYVGV